MGFTEEQQKAIESAKARVATQGEGGVSSFTPQQLEVLDRVKARISKPESLVEPRDASSLDESERLGPMPFINKSLANTLGAPVDLVAAGIDKAGSDIRDIFRGVEGVLGMESSVISDEEDISNFADNPVGGSQMIRDIFAKLGAPTPDRGPENTSEYVGSGIGEALGFAAPGLGAARGLAATRKAADPRIIQYIKRFADDVYNTAVKSPGKILAAEAGAGAGVGAAREISDKNELDPTMALLAELAGGIAGGGLTSIPTATGLALRGGKKGVEKAAFTFSEKGAFDRASARLQELAENPELAAKSVDDLKGTKLLPSARTEDPGLMALEQAIIKADPAEATRVSKYYSEAVQDLVSQIQKSGKSKSAREFLEAKRERLFAALDARLAKASDKAMDALKRNGDDLSSIDFQLIAREGLESALADAKAQEKLLWEAVPQDVKIPISSFSDKFKEIWKKVPSPQRKNIPEDARQFFNFLANKKVKAIKFSEMDGLYKELGQIARNARSGDQPNPFMASMAQELRESILDDMGNPVGDVKAKEAVQLARQFSFQINEKFKRGTIGKMLQFERTGGIKVSPERTLEVGVGKPRTQGMLAAREFEKAVTSIPQGGKGAATDVKAMQSVQDYVKEKFIEQVLDDNGAFNRSKADTFLLRNKEVLEMFPTLKDQLTSARNLDDARRNTKNWVEAFKKKYDSPSVSYASKYLNAPVGREIETIMNSKSPSPDQVMLELLKRIGPLDRENKKKVMEGFRSAMTEWLIDKHTSTTQVDIAGNLEVGGLAMKATLKQPEIKKAFNLVYEPEEMRRLKGLVDELAKINRQMKFNEKQSAIIDDLPSKLIELPFRYLSTKATNKLAGLFGGGNAGTDIQLAQMTSNESKRLLRSMNVDKAKQILIDAHKDPELYKALLLNQRTASEEAVKKANRKINSWLLGPGSRLLDEEEEEE